MRIKYLWIIYQSDNVGWDTYDSAVVVAESEKEASQIVPHCNLGTVQKSNWAESSIYGGWARSPEHVTVECIGVADPELELNSVVCSSFNAG